VGGLAVILHHSISIRVSRGQGDLRLDVSTTRGRQQLRLPRTQRHLGAAPFRLGFAAE
jgi:hypothetical protein